MKNETAVQKLFSVIEGVNQYALDNPLWETMLRCKARLMEIEKQQIIEAFTHEDNTTWNKELRTKAAEQYYDDTYGN